MRQIAQWILVMHVVSVDIEWYFKLTRNILYEYDINQNVCIIKIVVSILKVDAQDVSDSDFASKKKTYARSESLFSEWKRNQ